ncbi:MAG: branched-chain amino acid ABC transporter permease [Gammaproteobacteria bacterium]|nr:branched-chain amino acid ABC transporter permease [Gammaproteobacteria bacterium]
MIAYTLLAGLLFGLYFSLVATGLNLVFGVMRLINLAHGDFLMLGAFLAYGLYTAAGVNPLYTIPAEIAAFMLAGIALYYAVVPRLLSSRDPEMLSFILLFGVSQIIEALAVIAFGNDQRAIPATVFGSRPVFLFGQSFPAAWVVSAAVSAIALLAVYVYLYHSRLGYATRAVMASRDEAASTGINVHRVSAVALGAGLALAATAGAFSAFMLGSIEPDMGIGITTVSFAVIVIGSLGNPLGTVLGGLVYGLGLMFMETYFPSWADLLPYVLLILILLVRPSGLLGKRVRLA